MVDKIHAYIDHEFSGVPETKKIREVKEELIANLTEKYYEQLSQGKSEEQAYSIVIAGLGDLSELIESVQSEAESVHSEDHDRKKRALLVAVAIALYIISPLMIVIFNGSNNARMGFILFFCIIAMATGLMVYQHMLRPVERRGEESRPQWGEGPQGKAFGAFHSAYWSFVVVIYFLISFLFSAWGYSWILFIAAGAIESLLKGMMHLKEDKK